MTKLTVVLISKNQAWNVERLVESVLAGTEGAASREVVLVDSASTDETVQKASRYPISVLRLREGQQLTPAAGRYVGYQHTEGDLILFLDGDMELHPGWLEGALQVLQDEPNVAAITGQVVDLPKAAGPDDDKPPLQAGDANAVTEIPYGGGAAMYRRSVLQEVGTFNPYLHSDEEPEMCIRIRHAGYRIVRLQRPIAYHYTDPKGGLSTKVARWRRKLYLGAGQALRYHVGDEVFGSYVRERGYGLIPALGLLAGFISLLWALVSGRRALVQAWTLGLGLVVAGDVFRKQSLYRTACSLLERLFIVDGTLRGFLIEPLDPSSYPCEFDFVKRG